jgi:rhamnulokinase
MTSKTANFLAFDLGASSGRLGVGCWNGDSFAFREMHRFPNGPVAAAGNLYWDVLRLWSEIKDGLRKYAAAHSAAPAGIGVDAWGVDFALLGTEGRLLGNPHCYRDRRTDGVPAEVFKQITPEELFAETGVQSWQINTLFQVYSLLQSDSMQLSAATTLLTIPDLFHYWLCNERIAERTAASTTEMLKVGCAEWALPLLRRLGIPVRILPPIVQPGTLLGRLRCDVSQDSGLPSSVPVIAVAAHDSASAVAAIPDLDSESVFISSGTWSIMGIETPVPITSREACNLSFTNEAGVNGTTLFLRNITGLWLLQECMRQWQLEGRAYTWDQVLLLAKEATPYRYIVDPDAPDFVAPRDMRLAVRSFCRNKGQPEPADDRGLIRCCIESLAFRYRWVLENLERIIGHELGTIRIVGGGAQNSLLCQITADTCRRLVVAGPAEASMLGNVMMQAITIGELANAGSGRQSIRQSVQLQSYEPHPNSNCDAAYNFFCSVAH